MSGEISDFDCFCGNIPYRETYGEREEAELRQLQAFWFGHEGIIVPSRDGEKFFCMDMRNMFAQQGPESIPRYDSEHGAQAGQINLVSMATYGARILARHTQHIEANSTACHLQKSDLSAGGGLFHTVPAAAWDSLARLLGNYAASSGGRANPYDLTGEITQDFPVKLARLVREVYLQDEYADIQRVDVVGVQMIGKPEPGITTAEQIRNRAQAVVQYQIEMRHQRDGSSVMTYVNTALLHGHFDRINSADEAVKAEERRHLYDMWRGLNYLVIALRQRNDILGIPFQTV